MIGWRRKKDGFEWHDYVRTTILLRRARRRERLDAAREAAIKGVKGVGVAAASGLKDAGHVAADGLRKAGHKGREASAAGLGAAAAGSADLGGRFFAAMRRMFVWSAAAPRRFHAAMLPHIRKLVSGSGHLLGAALTPLATLVHERRLASLFGAIATAAAVGCAARVYAHGFDTTAFVIATLAICAAVASALPHLVVMDRPKPLVSTKPSANQPVLRMMAGGGFAALVVLGIGQLLSPGGEPRQTNPDAPRIAIPKQKAAVVATAAQAAGTLAGRAVAVSGDTLRIGGQRVRLAEIEAPERGQSCPRSTGQRWRCDTAATNALAKLIRGRKVECVLNGDVAGGLSTASCRHGETDLAAELVRGGHVFATEGFFASYSSLESDAREKRRGIWAGNPERPADYRAARWEAARKSAPEGCPIKGQVSRSGRTYVLPWASGYERVKVRETRGGRWFCSEDEALSAGWRRSESS
ncbi:MAG: thermonuclease family protein [Hyphomicrobiaceae bacterium]|nr:thermonuclease family protein [Hyphomicrobiaceae bacterium]